MWRKLACAVTTVLNDGGISAYAEKTWGFKIAISDRGENDNPRFAGCHRWVTSPDAWRKHFLTSSNDTRYVYY